MFAKNEDAVLVCHRESGRVIVRSGDHYRRLRRRGLTLANGWDAKILSTPYAQLTCAQAISDFLDYLCSDFCTNWGRRSGVYSLKARRGPDTLWVVDVLWFDGCYTITSCEPLSDGPMFQFKADDVKTGLKILRDDVVASLKAA